MAKNNANVISDAMLDQILGEAKSQEDLFGAGGIIKNLSKRLMERLLQEEMTEHLGYAKHAVEGHNSGNSRNGTTSKIVKTGNGDIATEVPRDRNSEFDPVLVGKRKSRLELLNEQVLFLYARGMTVRDIQSYLKELYGTEISGDLITRITDGVLEEVNDWRNRPLDKLYGTVAKISKN
jgi:putative transposase